ncbi:MAG TPA: type II secretion system F family protein [Gaiellales bacterium]|nr:type II secretion system F family protein [Gaiellales bacterium]
MIAFALALAGLVAATVLLLAHAVRLGRRSTAQAVAHVAAYGYGATAPLTTARQVARSKQNLRLENAMAGVARRLSSGDYETRLRMRLLQAGMYGSRPSRFLMIRVLSGISFGSFGVIYSHGAPNALFRLLMILGGPVLGFMLPDSLLSMRIRSRHARIERDCADMIDLLAITVQAGLGLDQALKVTGDRLTGPLADEMRLMLNEIRVGQSRQEALKRLSERAPTPTVRSFSRSMAQSESMGVSIGQTLKALAMDARTRKRHAAEELAQKAPIKMIFPLATCFFPAILMIAAGPGVLALMKALGS